MRRTFDLFVPLPKENAEVLDSGPGPVQLLSYHCDHLSEVSDTFRVLLLDTEWKLDNAGAKHVAGQDQPIWRC